MKTAYSNVPFGIILLKIASVNPHACCLAAAL